MGGVPVVLTCPCDLFDGRRLCCCDEMVHKTVESQHLSVPASFRLSGQRGRGRWPRGAPVQPIGLQVFHQIEHSHLWINAMGLTMGAISTNVSPPRSVHGRVALVCGTWCSCRDEVTDSRDMHGMFHVRVDCFSPFFTRRVAQAMGGVGC